MSPNCGPSSGGRISSTLVTRGRSLRLSINRITNPPMMNAMATGTGANKYFLMVLMNMTPSTAAGRNASTTFSVKRCDLASRGSVETTVHKRARYSQHTARMAAN